MTPQQKQRAIKKLAQDVMDIAHRRMYGLGECGYYFEIWGFEAVRDNDETLDEYDIDTGDGINFEERKRFEAERPEAYKLWREIVRGAENMSDTLDDMGVTRFD